MSGEPIRLGPFAGGINSWSDPAALSDVEVLDCVNFEVDLDGSLFSRPPIVQRESVGAPTTNLVINPSVETNLTGYSGAPRALMNNASTITRDSGPASFATGTQCIKCDVTTSPNSGFNYQDITVAAGPVSITADVQVVSPGREVRMACLNNGTWLESMRIQDFHGKTKLVISFTAVATDLTLRIYWDALFAGPAATFYVDAFQVEQKSAPTLYCDGTQPFCIWSGTAHASTSSRTGWNNTNFRILTTAFFGNQNYYIVSHASGIWAYSQGVWTLITNTIQAMTAVQWKEPASGNSGVYIPARPGEANPGGWWSPSVAFTPLTALPKCHTLLQHKDRLYAAGVSTTPSVMYFSKILDGGVWTPGDNINISISDGEVIVDMIVFNDAITIFKTNSTYIFPFDTNPTSGVVRRISGTIGVSGKDCVFIYETGLYALHDNNVYEVINYDFSRLNTKVPFEYDSTAPAPYAQPFFISRFEDRLVARYYNRIYVYGFRTRTWTRWETAQYFGPLWRQLGLPTGTGLELYYSGSCLTTDKQAYQIKSGYETGFKEEMKCTLDTKIYDMAISAKYKRLFWWGADINTIRPVKGTVIPITSVYKVTWGQLAAYKWNELKTWDNPLIEPPAIVDSVTVGGGSYRRFIKFLKGIRFRQVQFKIEMLSSGEPVDSPARFFNITAFINTKQTVVKKVS